MIFENMKYTLYKIFDFQLFGQSVHNAINPPPFDFVDLKIWIGQLSKTVDMAMCLSSVSVKNLKIPLFFQ